MVQQVKFSFLEKIQTQCPEHCVTVLGYGSQLFELIKIEFETLYIRPIKELKKTNEQIIETQDAGITGYWYLERDWNVKVEEARAGTSESDNRIDSQDL